MGFANHDETGFGGKPDFAMDSMISLGESFDEERLVRQAKDLVWTRESRR